MVGIDREYALVKHFQVSNSHFPLREESDAAPHLRRIAHDSKGIEQRCKVTSQIRSRRHMDTISGLGGGVSFWTWLAATLFAKHLRQASLASLLGVPLLRYA